jgi:hypothetical protein
MVADYHRVGNDPKGRAALTLESIWQSLEDGEWKSKAALKQVSGADELTLSRIIDLLKRWSFVDIIPSPELLVRRKPGSISPLEILETLHRLEDQTLPTTIRPRVAERVACRICGSRELNPVGVNQVECNHCHERQWYILSLQEKSRHPARRLLEQILIRIVCAIRVH